MRRECSHGGRFIQRLGSRLEALTSLDGIVPADVLDAWFLPSPRVLAVLRDHLSVLTRTSPPLTAEPLVQAISDTFQVTPEAILPGAGSSALIFLSLPCWVDHDSVVSVPDPGYGEYAHVASTLGAEVRGYRLWPGDTEELEEALTSHADLVVIVNPNNPTGWKTRSSSLLELIESRSPDTVVWIDEAYAAYNQETGSLASYAASHRGVFVSRSFSKSHALSGLRVACLFGHPDELAPLRAMSPPWPVSFPAQAAAIQALNDGAYYEERYTETLKLRADLQARLSGLGMDILASEANWILCGHERSESLIQLAESAGVYLRDPSSMCSRGWPGAVRVAVRSPEENRRIVCTLGEILHGA